MNLYSVSVLMVTMVHPTELLRTNSNVTRTFSAPRAQLSEYELDCGLTQIPILNKCCNLEKFADPKVFIVFLSLVGFLQGVTLTYFRETARHWGKHYNISNENIDWLIYTNEFFVGILALVVSHWGFKIHRMSWIGGLTIFQAISSAVLLVPEIYRKNYNNEIEIKESNLCGNLSLVSTTESEVNYIALVVLAVFQIIFAMATISFISHGITYLDDNTSSHSSPGYIGIALASRELGKQAGLYFSWIPTFTKTNKIFASPAWLSIASATFIAGVLISMFPRSMPSTLVKTMSASIMDLASGHEPRMKKKVDGFFKTLFHLLRNEILLVNIFSAVLLQSGLINFNIFEKYFKQTRFQVSELNDISNTQFTTNILRQPLVAISLIAVGFLVAKTKPQLKSLVKWNIAAIILAIAFFASTAFLKCEPNTKYSTMLSTNNCERYSGNNCSHTSFQPVCANSQTYFSPCYAGCTNTTTNNSRKLYSGCRGISGSTANEGPCNEQTCDLYYAISQVNTIFTSAVLGTTLVTNLIINMRCILSRHKSGALGLEATLTALITYLPVRAIYGAVAENYCIHPKYKRTVCKLYSKKFADFLSFCTLGLMIASLVLAVVVLILLKLRPIQENDEDDDSDSVELEQMPRERADNEEDRRSESITDSLLEMENVGDDHDSIGSVSRLDETRPRLSRNRIIESDL